MSFDTDKDKQRFLQEFGEYYGYKHLPKDIDQIRATEFKRLNGVVYLDHAGATLYSESQLESIFKDLNSTLYGNPHSQSNCSLKTTDTVGEARREVLNYFNASPKEYSVIFTSGATAALKLIGETFPWNGQSSFMYTMENHNSVLGIREYALNKGATALAVDIQETADHGESRNSKSAIKITQHPEQRRVEGGSNREDPIGTVYHLFAFPSECNFSGLKFNLDLVKLIKEDSHKVLEGSPRGLWMVLIDAAKGCATDPLDLSKHKADFVTVSFYKIFGYPTGLGALIVRNEAAKLLKKTYFSGGTVAASIADIDFVKRRDGIEDFFEDGTLSYLSIASTLHGFRILSTLTMHAVSRHTTSLATYVRKALSAMRHENGNHVCTLYGTDKVFQRMGPTISFNLKRPDGSWFGYREVEKLASLSGIQLRTGCFCNPGACAKYLGLSHSDVLSNLEAGHVCWDDNDVLNGKPTGAVRVSFGYMSTFEDAKKLLNFIEATFASLHSHAPSTNSFRERTTSPDVEGNGRVNDRYFLKSVSVYPIKSCMGFSVESWPLTSTGLLHDREWLLKSPSGEILTQKKVPDMCYITTFIDLNVGKMFVESPRCKDKLQIEVRSDLSASRKDEVDIHTQRFEVVGYHNDIDIWFSNAIGRPCTLVRSSRPQSYGCSIRNRISGLPRDFATEMNFVNEGQFLLISEESVIDLNSRLRSNVQKGFQGQLIQIAASRFRPNLVVSGGEAYAEDQWRSLRIGKKDFISMGRCNRCEMINLSFQSGKVQRSSEPLATLASYRRVKGKISFGILLRYEDGSMSSKDIDTWVRVGEEIFPCRD